jgi:alpha-tubulin suppressor-like RCC1 family protein
MLSAATPGPCVVVPDQIDAFGDHTCVRMSDGTAWCWGLDSDGQLGDRPAIVEGGADPVSEVPVPVLSDTLGPLRGVEQIVTGERHTCALIVGGSVVCWGNDVLGSLGDGAGSEPRSLIPVRVMTSELGDQLEGVVRIASGAGHTCAIDGDGGLWCWGANSRGQVGDDSTDDSAVALRVGSQTFTDVAAGSTHTCGIGDPDDITRAMCWGGNESGQLGTGDTVDSHVPAVVVSEGVDQLAGPGGLGSGHDHACADVEDGLFCWGNNESYQLGTETTGPYSEYAQPVSVSFSGMVLSRIDGGAEFTCASFDDGQLFCWGSDSEGQQGNGGATGPMATPVLVGTAGETRDFATGRAHVCTIDTDFVLRCWGSNAHGQIGVGELEDEYFDIPVPVDADAMCP